MYILQCGPPNTEHIALSAICDQCLASTINGVTNLWNWVSGWGGRCPALHCTAQHFDLLSRIAHIGIVSCIFISHLLFKCQK